MCIRKVPAYAFTWHLVQLMLRAFMGNYGEKSPGGSLNLPVVTSGLLISGIDAFH